LPYNNALILLLLLLLILKFYGKPKDRLVLLFDSIYHHFAFWKRLPILPVFLN